MYLLKFYFLTLIVLFLSCSTTLLSQTAIPYYLNTEKGLPSNHVYYLLKDKNNYLWIATNKGIVKYDGYNMQHFGCKEGIKQENIWQLFEDKFGRIWIVSLSPEIGYINNNEYHKVFVGNEKTIYPTYLTKTDKGIVFKNIIDPMHPKLMIEKNDTLSSYDISLQKHELYVNETGIYIQNNRGFFKIILKNGQVALKKINWEKKDNYIYRNYIVEFSYEGTKHINPISIYDILNDKSKTTKLSPNEYVYMLNEFNNDCYLTSNHHVYKLSPSMSLKRIAFVDSFFYNKVVSPGEILTCIRDDFWGDCITTDTKGVIFALKPTIKATRLSHLNNVFIKENSKYSLYSNKLQSKLFLINKKNSNSQKINIDFRIYNVLNYANDSFLLLTSNGLQWITPKGFVKFKHLNKIYTDGCFKNKNELFVCGITGISKIDLNKIDSKPEIISNEKYNNVLYDKKNDLLIAYSSNSILLKIKNKNKHISINTFQIKHSFLIEKIILKNNNLIIKTNETIYAINLNTLKTKRLFKNINTDNSILLSTDSSIILVGKFGIAFQSFKSGFNFSEISSFFNVKHLIYENVYSAYISNSKLNLNTNKGQLVFEINNKSSFNSINRTPLHQLNIKHEKHVLKWKKQMQLTLKQTNYAISFDFINPLGTGEVKYEYLIPSKSSKWKYLSSNELNIYDQNLQPGKKQELFIRVQDDILKTAPIKMYVYIIPFWWQTISGRILIALGILIVLMTITWTTIQTTKKIVNKKNRQQQLLLEVKNLNLALELKSLYAQINPHFIFNTLNTALYFIKKQKNNDAYTHIASFSQLLRGYLKSSRNKYISLYEEINNLTHYIKLQQARFDHKFEFEITSDLNINLSTTNLPTLLLQPLVENAIQHGLLPKEGHGKLLLKFKKNEEEGSLLCIIDDNGIGREKSKQLYANNKSISYGTDLINKLIEVYNHNEKIKIDLRYIDKTPPYEGTTVIISIQQL